MMSDRSDSRQRRGEGSGDRRGGRPGPGMPDDRMLTVLMALFGAVVALIVSQMARWQILEGPRLAAEAEEYRSNTIKLHAKRGTIYDRNGNVLAMSEDCYNLTCNPSQIEKPYLTAQIIAKYLGGDPADYVEKLEGDGTFAYVAKTVSTSDGDAIISALTEKELPGVFTEPDNHRVYPYGAVGSQVLGAMGADGHGLTGLESQYDELLAGTDGEMVMEVGRYGMPIAGARAKITEAVDGTDIVISIDINVQRVAEENIVKGVKEYKSEAGSVMAIDPRTGEILAACSTPLFDVSDLSVVEEGSTSLRLVSNSYEPGSIFKVLTSAIGIEGGMVDPSTSLYVPWYVQVGSDMVYDDDGRSVDMYMTLREILRRSSNTGAALVAQDEIGADAFAAGVESFGIGHLTGIDYPGEVEGIVKSRGEYDGSSVGSMAFGQGLAIPLVQMVRAVGAIANGGVATTPHFLVREGSQPKKWPEGTRIVSENTAREVTDMMRTVIEEGTGVPAQVPGYDIAGKTGTGETADTTKGGYVEDKFTSSLIGFAPASNPSVLVYVGLNDCPYLAYDSAAPLFSSIMGEALIDMGILPSS